MCCDYQSTAFWRKQHRVSKIKIFTDAQAPIKRMQPLRLALDSRRIPAEIDCSMEIRWCSAHEGIAGNEDADQFVVEGFRSCGGGDEMGVSLARRGTEGKKGFRNLGWGTGGSI